MSKTDVWIWRVVRLLAFVIPLYIIWGIIPKPVLVHTPAWLEAQAKREAYQFSLDDQAEIDAIDQQVNQLVDEAVQILPTIDDPVARLNRLVGYEVELQKILSRHPFYPSAMLETSRYGQMREAAEIYGGVDADPLMVKAIQEHPEVFQASIDLRNQLVGEYGIGYNEPVKLTFPYYSLLILRFFLILFLASWCSALAAAAMISEQGFSPVAIARRELGSCWAIIFVAPISNAFLGDLYERLERYYSECRYSPSSREFQIEHRQIPVQSFAQAVCLLLEPIWETISWREVFRLSLKFRYAVVTSLAIMINIAVVSGAHAATIEEYSYIGDDGAVTWSSRFLLPNPGGGTWQIDIDNWGEGPIAAGYRGDFQPIGGEFSFQPRFLLVTQDGDFAAVKFQGLVVGTIGNYPCYLFSSIKVPEGRCSFYNEFGVNLFPESQPSLSLVVIETNRAGGSADWRIGPELSISLGATTLKLHQGFGLGGGPGETRVCLVIPL